MPRCYADVVNAGETDVVSPAAIGRNTVPNCRMFNGPTVTSATLTLRVNDSE